MFHPIFHILLISLLFICPVGQAIDGATTLDATPVNNACVRAGTAMVEAARRLHQFHQAKTSSGTDPYVGKEDTTVADLEVRLDAFLNFRFPQGYDKKKIVVLGTGALSKVILVTPNQGPSAVFMIPAQPRLEFTRKHFQTSFDLVVRLEERDPIAKKRVVHIDRAYLDDNSGLKGKLLPVLEVEHCKGSLASLASEYGPTASFQTNVHAFKEMARAVGAFHRNRLMHGDIKPPNFLEADQRLDRDNAIVLSDLNTSSKFGRNAEPSFTPGFYPLVEGVHSRGAQEALEVAGVDRDTYALMISKYVNLLGLSLPSLDRQFLGGSPGSWRVRPLVSAYSVNPNVPPNLSMIAWTHFHSAKEDYEASRMAERYEEAGKAHRFLPDYYGPKILAKIPDEDAAKMVLSAKELKEPLVRDLIEMRRIEEDGSKSREQREKLLRDYVGTNSGLTPAKIRALLRPATPVLPVANF